MNLQKIYEYALQREREGYRFFRSHADDAGHAAAAEIFGKLADEEHKHIEFIERLMAESDPAATADMNVPADTDWFEKRARREVLEQSLLESMIPDVAVLRTAYLIERDLAEFYEMAAQHTSGQARQAFQTLAVWERSHERLFKQLHDEVFHHYTAMPWGG